MAPALGSQEASHGEDLGRGVDAKVSQWRSTLVSTPASRETPQVPAATPVWWASIDLLQRDATPHIKDPASELSVTDGGMTPGPIAIEFQVILGRR